MCAKSVAGFRQIQTTLRRIERNVEKEVKSTLLEFAKKIYSEAMSKLPEGAKYLKASFAIETGDNGYRVTIYSGEEMAAYVEFGTGFYAKTYLSGQPLEMKVEAIKFFVNGKGKMPARPYLFPAFYNYRDWLLPEMDRRIQKVLNAA